jgi:pimeloyl-ACP methyl ester carboxylesterase
MKYIIFPILFLNYVSHSFMGMNMMLDVNKNSLIHSIPRKTILDLGDAFVNSTYYEDLDITVATRSSNKFSDRGPVIFLPGLDMSGLSIYPNMIRASEERDVIVFLAGYDRNQTLHEISERVVKYISSNSIKDILLIGESFGGLLAIKCSSRIKKRLKKIILINPATSFPRTQWLEKIVSTNSNQTNDVTSLILGHGPRIENILKSAMDISKYFPEHTYSYMITYLYMVFNMIVTDPVLIQTRIIYYLGIETHKVDFMCRMVGTPTLIVIGKEDKLLPSCKESDKLSKMIKGSVVIKLKKTGHMVTSDVFDIRHFIE